MVTEHEPDRLVDEMKVDRPFPMHVRYELQDAPEGTLVAIHAVGTPGRFFGWARPGDGPPGAQVHHRSTWGVVEHRPQRLSPVRG